MKKNRGKRREKQEKTRTEFALFPGKTIAISSGMLYNKREKVANCAGFSQFGAIQWKVRGKIDVDGAVPA
ncbi:MAG: hypothetical protein MR374_02980 [Clostridia bacterium]|nr:hypothetical protein [Clostridia bacterium]MDD7483464.1 hypothetical protein [Clostridia bacterium]MDY5559234.1 hypothetical protein [Candidatus Heritagella sp.]